MALSREEYASIQERLILFGNFVEDLDIDAFLETINHSLNVSPFFVAPVAYQVATPRLEGLAALARAVRDVQRAHRELKDVVVGGEHLAGQARSLLPGVG